MKSLLIGFTIFTTLCLASFSANSKELISEFRGSESKTTLAFEVKAPWIVDWRTHGDYPGQMAVSMSLVDAKTGEYIGKIMTTKYVDNGIRLFNEDGIYQVQVNASLASWTVRIEQLTQAEAEQYTPVDQRKLRKN